MGSQLSNVICSTKFFNRDGVLSKDMKIATLLFLCCLALLRVHASVQPKSSAPDILATTEAWTLPAPAYAQMRMVPSKTGIPAITMHDWNGPWTTYNRFRVYFGYVAGEQISPAHIHFVTPRVGLEGWTDQSCESHDETLRLFSDDKVSSKSDIEIKMVHPPTNPEIGTEYKVATVSGKDAPVAWDVYLRFVTQKPKYVWGE